MTQIGEGVAIPSTPKVDEPCKDEGDHDWEEVDSGESPDDQINNLESMSSNLEGKSSRKSQKRGYDFEKKAVIDNKEKLPIDKCSKEYKCTKCPKTQEVDIVGDGRVAEAKSQNSNGVKKKSSQCKRLKSIQSQHFDSSKNHWRKLMGI